MFVESHIAHTDKSHNEYSGKERRAYISELTEGHSEIAVVQRLGCVGGKAPPVFKAVHNIEL